MGKWGDMRGEGSGQCQMVCKTHGMRSEKVGPWHGSECWRNSLKNSRVTGSLGSGKVEA